MDLHRSLRSVYRAVTPGEARPCGIVLLPGGSAEETAGTFRALTPAMPAYAPAFSEWMPAQVTK